MNDKQPTKPKRIKFTQHVVERLRPPAEGYLTVWDANLPGFGLRISSKGRKSWIVFYRVNGQEVSETLGTMAVIPSLADARERARASMSTAHSGIHPVQARKAKQAAEQKAAVEASYTLEPLLEDFIRRHHHGSRPNTVYEVRRLCRRAIPFIGTIPVKQIAKSDILSMMNELCQTRQNVWRSRTGPALAEANGVLRHLRSMFRWALDEDLIECDPTQGVRSPMGKGKTERERVLSDDEIKALWRICDEDLKFPFGRIVQLLLLTGQREREIGNMTWSELDIVEKRVLSLPSTRTKNKRAHDVHLSDLAVEIINKIPRFADNKNFVFSLSGDKPVEAYQDAKGRIDRRMTELLGTVEGWVFHDLRRTMATGMANLNVAPHIADKILNHVSGTIRGVAAIYNRGQYIEERKAALDAWSRKVELLVYPERASSNVVALRVGQLTFINAAASACDNLSVVTERSLL